MTTDAATSTDTRISHARRIRDLAGERPDEVVLRHIARSGAESTATWAELDDRSDRLAGALAGRGVGHGDRIGLGLRNSPEFVLSVLAAWKLGAVPVPVRWDVPEWELTRLKEVIEPRVHLDDTDIDWIDASAERPRPELPDAVSPQVNGICSSGSTGTPKVILPDRPALYDERMGAVFAENWAPVPRPQTILVLAPMYHANGFATLYQLLAGDHLVILEKFNAAQTVEAIERHRVSTFTATPTMLQRVADLPGVDERDLTSIEWFMQGAAPMPPSLVHRWAKLVGPERIVMAYGMTEGLGITALRGDEWMEHQGSVGRGHRGTEVRILDDDGEPVPVGEPGLIFLRSPSYGGYTYLGDAPRMRSTPDGFQTAGDVGRLDEDGYLYIFDRRSDMIVSGGANVFPAEVEAALIEHPDLADVVVIGLADPEWGRRVHAIVEPADPARPPSQQELLAYAKSRLSPYKVPKTIEFVDAVPRSAATKVNRAALIAEREG